ncbi:phosphatidylinositol--trisphosphate 3 [Plasmopara halstedii]|uniref:Phosphatidylinositol--trisphosphate 3 n=1 Tax=Plasmopara halstedii TaxID=4781 RepID=A0A0P1ALE8_PLAHL|nr:phosphatidylinositol--trisphosphate 3 [Plasmopara halstedii]CEG41903.1 phosphatidylinositol--trisphosphate 3 [Plasmopara halstedii]|eukprot:XP_024578272.1 phosphatidylinositol--trisphosphate 3 [Plasmopara halstedii]
MQRMLSIPKIKLVRANGIDKEKDRTSAVSDQLGTVLVNLGTTPIRAWGPDDCALDFQSPLPSPPRAISTSSKAGPTLKVDAQLDAERVFPMSSSPSSSLTSSRRYTNALTFHLKHLVSKEKRRYFSNGFDLDLTYITRRLVALGYPAELIEGIYRNHYRDVFRFFEQRHPGRYRVYNLCAERRYASVDKFHGRVAEFGFEDHCPPPLSLLILFCQDVHSWLQSNPENIVAVHCKAGKGRTGVMLCAYMLYARIWRSASGALEYFAAARSMKLQGVTIISQRRFIGYFSELCRRSESANDAEQLGSYEEEEHRERAMSVVDYHAYWLKQIQEDSERFSSRENIRLIERPHAKPMLPVRVKLVLVAVVLCGVTDHKRTRSSAADWRVRVECGAIRPRATSFDLAGTFQRQIRSKFHGEDKEEVVELKMQCSRVLVWDEIMVELRRRNGSALGHFWFHTAFVPQVDDHYELELTKIEIDKVAKDANQGHKKFAPDFSMRLLFERVTD